MIRVSLIVSLIIVSLIISPEKWDDKQLSDKHKRPPNGHHRAHVCVLDLVLKPGIQGNNYMN